MQGRIQRYIRETSSGSGRARPIFEIMLFEHEEKEIGEKGSGIPDIGLTDTPGFFHELETAITAMHENAAGMNEGVFKAGFVLCRFPGLYRSVGKEGRIFFSWNEKKRGYFEREEPSIFEKISL